MMSRGKWAVLALMGLAGVFLLAWQNANDSRFIETNILALIPEGERPPAVEQAVHTISERIEKRHILLIENVSEIEAIRAAAQTAKLMRQSGLYDRIQEKTDAQTYQDVARFYFPHRYRLLSRDLAKTFDEGQQAYLVENVIREIYNPSSVAVGQLKNDPFLLFGRFLNTLNSKEGTPFKLVDGYLVLQSASKSYVLLSANITDSPFDIGNQQKIITLKEDIERTLGPDTSVLYAGVIEHVIAGVTQGKKEMRFVGGISIAGLVLLLAVVFRSPMPLVCSLFSVGLGVSVGFAVCIAIYGNIHLITLVAGASLIGISVDYALHFFADMFRDQSEWNAEQALSHIGPGITLGLITSLFGFSAMFFASLPGLVQLAIFSSAGLLTAYLTVVLFYPFIVRKQSVKQRPTRLWGAIEIWLARWRRLAPKQSLFAVGLIIATGAVVNFYIEPTEDVRLLQKPDPRIVETENRIKALTGQNLALQFFLITGPTHEEVREHEEVLLNRLQGLPDAVRPIGWHAVSDFLPSLKRQDENLARVRTLTEGERPAIDRLQEQIGLSDEVVTAFRKDVMSSPPLMFEDWQKANVFPDIASLWLPSLTLPDGTQAMGSVVMLNGIRDISAMQQIALELDHVQFVDNIADISTILRDYHGHAQSLLVAAYAMILLLLAFRYGAIGALYVIAPPLAAAAFTVIALYMLGEAYNLFNIVGLILVLAIGIDYTLFMREARDASTSTMAAIFMSAASTILTFGLLAFSSMPALHSFGLTVGVGIVVALVLAPLAGLSLVVDHNDREEA
ncbi:MAG: MMPL family transporter [Sphingomonadales bacterium]|jgi:predicted exporter